MRKINYRLIVSDFDGTLLKNDGTISEYTRERIRKYIADGGHFAVSTGRMPSGILPQVKDLGLTGLVSCGQGSVILDIESGKPVFECTMPNAVAVQVCEAMEKLGLHIQVFGFSEYYANMDDEALKWYESAVKTKGIVVTDKPISAFVKETGMKPYKILAIVEPKDNERILNAIQAAGFTGCYVTKSSERLVEVGNANASKGRAVEYLAKYYETGLDKTVAVGDQLNDLSMILTAGLGIAVKNAVDELKKQATVLGYSNDEDAIAKIIENYGYTED
ncbi:MAG: HAD family phosphatase [Clostridia bacterium]|nr:HAD family phosphatase [Clostridia bacterium]